MRHRLPVVLACLTILALAAACSSPGEARTDNPIVRHHCYQCGSARPHEHLAGDRTTPVDLFICKSCGYEHVVAR